MEAQKQTDDLNRLWALAKGASDDRMRAAKALRDAEAKEWRAHETLRAKLNGQVK